MTYAVLHPSCFCTHLTLDGRAVNVLPGLAASTFDVLCHASALTVEFSLFVPLSPRHLTHRIA